MAPVQVSLMRAPVQVFGPLALLAATSGCGLVFQGVSQNVQLTSAPSESYVSFSGSEAVTPSTVRVSRRRGWRVIRGEHRGYIPACELVPCRLNPTVVTLDAIPLAIPLAVDAIFGALRTCPNEVSIDLEPEIPGYRFPPLPTDQEVLRAHAGQEGNLCKLHKSSRIVVLPGEVSRPHKVLGEVTANRSDMRKHLVRMSPQGLDRVLRIKAYEAYGHSVDALITTGTTFEGTRLGYSAWRGIRNRAADGFARALAIQYTPDESKPTPVPPRRTISTRLQELQDAREKQLISEEEFDEQRLRIIHGF